MASCNCDECLCFDVCDGYTKIKRGLMGKCEHFKDRTVYVEIKDCTKCKHLSKYAGQYPCSRCRNLYKDKFEPNFDIRSENE